MELRPARRDRARRCRPGQTLEDAEAALATRVNVPLQGDGAEDAEDNEEDDEGDE